jgi:hypothetical protein
LDSTWAKRFACRSESDGTHFSAVITLDAVKLISANNAVLIDNYNTERMGRVRLYSTVAVRGVHAEYVRERPAIGGGVGEI